MGLRSLSGAIASVLLVLGGSALAGSPADLGVPQNGFPSWDERTFQVLLNRDRADPQAALAGCAAIDCPDAPCYGPVPPLGYDYDLARSARFQVANLVKAHSPLAHHSPCLLNPAIGTEFPQTCDGDPACACQGPLECDCSQGTATDCSCDPSSVSCVTSPLARGSFFSPHWNGENLAAGYTDPASAEAGLLLEVSRCASSSCPADFVSCPDGTTNGHRNNILHADFNLMGGGVVAADAGMACYQGDWYAQDFGIFGPQPQKLVAGTHVSSGAASTTFYANWYDSSAPLSAVVHIDGSDHAMTVDRGSGGNVTFGFTTTLAAGCHSYFFDFQDSAGGSYLLPGSGVYQAGTTCSADYDSGAGAPDGGSPDGGEVLPKSSGCAQGGTASVGDPIALLVVGLLLARRRRAGSLHR